MPTGYTHCVQTGEVVTLKELALRCARGMEALVTMRDDAVDTPIPERLEPATKYYDDRIPEAQAILDTVPTMTPEECDGHAKQEYEEDLAEHLKSATGNYKEKRRYEAMIDLVEAWAPHPAIVCLQDFMLEQLRSSLDFDCGHDLPPPIRLPGEMWQTETLEKASRDLVHHTTKRDEEIVRTNERNEWLRHLRASLTV